MGAFRKVLFTCGPIGMMALTRYIFGWLLKYADTAGPDGSVLFSGTAVGAVFLAFRIFDGITDPVAGLVSDRWLRKGRERRQLLWFTFLLPPIGLILCFLPDHSMAPAVRWAWLAAGLFIFFVGYTFYIIPYWSLIDDYPGRNKDLRRVLSTLVGTSLIIATGIGAIVSPGLIASYGYLKSAMMFAVPGCCLMILPYFAKPPNTVASPGSVDGQRSIPHQAAPFVHALGMAFRHRRFMAVLVLFCGSQMSFTILISAAPFIAVQLLGGTIGDVRFLLGPLLGTAVLTFALVPWVSRKLGWERGLLTASLILVVVYGLSMGLGRGLVGSPLTTGMIIFALAGPLCAILLGLEGEAITACARERSHEVVSTYFGVFNFMVKVLNGVAVLLAGILVDLSRGDVGVLAIALMTMAAGGCLLVCIAGYFIMRPRAEVDHAV